MHTARLDRGTLGQVVWLTGNAHALIALAALQLLDFGGRPLFAAVLALLLVATIRPAWPALIPPVWFRAAGPVLLLLIIGDFVLAGADFLPPLIRMITLLAAYRMLQARTAREDLQLLLLSLFMLVICGALSLSLLFALLLPPYTALALVNLWLIHCKEPAAAGAAWRGFAWRPFMRLLLAAANPRFCLVSAGLYMLTNLLAVLLFLLLPRFEFGQALPFLKLPARGSLAGFSDQVRFGDIVNIQESDAVAFRVDVSGPWTDAPVYWRMAVLDWYDDGAFRRSPAMAAAARRWVNNRFPGNTRPAEAPANQVTIYYEGGISAYLPLPGPFAWMRFNNRQELLVQARLQTRATREIQAGVLFLRLEGVDAEHLFAPLPTASGADPDTLRALPGGAANAVILAAALERIGPLDEPGAWLRRAVAWLQGGRGYSLAVAIPAGEGDALLRWLAAGLPGHCELYAGSLVLLARAAGLPARMVTGFLGGDWNGFENYTMVRHRHAHAWCEVETAPGRWQRVDPTPGNDPVALVAGATGAGGALRVDRTWRAWVDSLRVQWYRRVVNFDRVQQREMVDAWRAAGRRGFASWRSWATDLRQQWRAWWQGQEERPTGADAPAPDAVVQVPAGGLLVPAIGVALLLLVGVRWVRRVRQPGRRERRLRRLAGRQLRRLARLPPQRRQADHAARLAAWRRIRYGAVEHWPRLPARAR